MPYGYLLVDGQAVAFTSSTQSAINEINYALIEMERFAINVTYKKPFQYLHGKRAVVVYFDHQLFTPLF